jgi:hypothetical protein
MSLIYELCLVYMSHVPDICVMSHMTYTCCDRSQTSVTTGAETKTQPLLRMFPLPTLEIILTTFKRRVRQQRHESPVYEALPTTYAPSSPSTPTPSCTSNCSFNASRLFSRKSTENHPPPPPPATMTNESPGGGRGHDAGAAATESGMQMIDREIDRLMGLLHRDTDTPEARLPESDQEVVDLLVYSLLPALNHVISLTGTQSLSLQSQGNRVLFNHSSSALGILFAGELLERATVEISMGGRARALRILAHVEMLQGGVCVCGVYVCVWCLCVCVRACVCVRECVSAYICTHSVCESWP